MQDEHVSPGEKPHPIAKAASGLGRGTKASVRGVARGSSYVWNRARGAARAHGAGESGLYRLIELHAFNAGGDASVAIALAGTIFFAQPGEARGQVALFLGITMLPFAVVAPLIGPLLDRFGHGRRWAIGATFAVRAILCIVMADAIAADNEALMFAAALGTLVSSKAYGVTRAAAVPRLVPDQLPLMKANSRISLAGVLGGAVLGPLAAGAATLGSEWALRFAFVIFAIGTVLAILLPPQADSSVGEKAVTLTGKPKRFKVPSSIVFSLRCNAGLRVLSGFCTMYMAFLLRQNPLPGWETQPTLLMGLVIGAAGLGSTIAIALGALARSLRPAYIGVAALIADTVVSIIVAAFYGLASAILFGLVVGIAQGLGKIALDAQIQDEIPEQQRTSAFARSETLLQLAWVLGGFIGIAMPLNPTIGLGVLAGLILVWTTYVVISRPSHAAG